MRTSTLTTTLPAQRSPSALARATRGFIGFVRRLAREKPLGAAGGAICLIFLLCAPLQISDSCATLFRVFPNAPEVPSVFSSASMN